MADKTKLFTDAAFDQAEVVILLDAYVRACRSLHDRGQPDIVTDVIAERLITLGQSRPMGPAEALRRGAGHAFRRTLNQGCIAPAMCGEATIAGEKTSNRRFR